MKRSISVFALAFAFTSSLALADGGGSIGSGENNLIELNRDQATEGSIRALTRFPAPESGKKRIAIHLPRLEKESDKRVELVVGTIREVGCNRLVGGSALETSVLEETGDDFVKATTNNMVASTAMGCPSDTVLKNEFVEGKRMTLQYRSYAPVVIYAEKGAIIKYRVWSAPEKFSETE